MAIDIHANFAYSTLLNSITSGAATLTVASGGGANFPAAVTGGASFNATIWPSGTQPKSTTAEIVKVTNITVDVFSITRAQEGTTALAFSAGDQIAANITSKTLTDIEANY